MDVAAVVAAPNGTITQHPPPVPSSVGTVTSHAPVATAHWIQRWYPCPKTLEVAIDATVHLLIIVVALTILFNLKVSHSEEAAMTSAIDEQIDGLIQPLKSGLTTWAEEAPCAEVTTAKDALDAVTELDSRRKRFEVSEGDTTKMHNAALLRDNAVIVGLVVLFTVVLSVLVAAEQALHSHCSPHPVFLKRCGDKRTDVIQVSENVMQMPLRSCKDGARVSWVIAQ